MQKHAPVFRSSPQVLPSLPLFSSRPLVTVPGTSGGQVPQQVARRGPALWQKGTGLGLSLTSVSSIWFAAYREGAPQEHLTLYPGRFVPRPSEARSELCSTYFNVPAGYLLTSKIKSRTPSGKNERKGRGAAGQQKQSKRNLCTDTHISTPHPLQEVSQSPTSS